MGEDVLAERHAALASPVRRGILELITASADPVDAALVAARFGMHITTARFHLEQLERAGLARREPITRVGRGRPRLAFRAVADSDDDRPVRELVDVLADALSHDADGGAARAEQAGERWSRSCEVAPAEDADGRVAALAAVFDRFGFEPEVREGEGESVLALHGCPFRDAAVARPGVVCSAHRGLLAGVLGRLGADAGDAGLQPFVEPELCVVHLRGALAPR